MGAVLEQWRLVPVGQEIVDVSEFVVDRRQHLERRLDAHLDARVVTALERPGAGVADHLTVARLRELRELPERLRQLRHAERDEEVLAEFDHPLRRNVLRDQRRGHVGRLDFRVGLDQVVDVAPALRPHVAEQVGRNRPVQRHAVLAVGLRQLAPDVAVKLLVQRLDLPPEARAFDPEGVGRHVVAGLPHLAEIREAELLRAGVGQLDETHVIVAHLR